jgi:hypothetical protein
MRSKLLVALSVLALAMPVSCTFNSTSETPEPASTAEPTEAEPRVVLSDSVRLEPLASIPTDKYPGLEGESIYAWLSCPLQDYGYYFSDCFQIESPYSCLEITCHSSCRVCVNKHAYAPPQESLECKCDNGLWLEVVELLTTQGGETGETMSLKVDSCQVDLQPDGSYETRLAVSGVGRASRYFMSLTNESSEPAWCDYTLALVGK